MPAKALTLKVKMSTKKDYDFYGIDTTKFNTSTGEIQTVCPKCSHTRKKKQVKCLSVNLDKEVWLCHHCAWSGSLKKGSTYNEPHYLKPDYQKPKFVEFDKSLPKEAVDFFATRNKIVAKKVYMPQIEDFSKAIGFPYIRDGEHVNTKWRDFDKNFRLEAGAEKIPFGLDDIVDAKTIIWVEGEMDKLSVEEAGFTNCISIPNGAPSPGSKTYNSHFDYMASCEELFAGKKHILCVDKDEPGLHLESELSRRLGKEFCSIVSYPDGFKDANEVLLGAGAAVLKEAIDNAKPCPITGIHDANSMYSKVMQLKDGGLPKGVSTGWQTLDQYITFRPAEMTIVTGIPNHGKSNFIDCLLLNIAKTNGWRVGMFSPENQPIELHAAGLCEKFNNKLFDDLGKDYIEATMAWLQKHFYWVLPDLEDDWSLLGILEKAKTLVYRQGINCFVIDPWNEIEHKRPGKLNETEYISWALGKIRAFGNMHHVHMIVIAHPTKLRKDEKTGFYPVPRPYDIAGSNAWLAKADNCMAVYRHFETGMEHRVDIFIQKIRFKEVGKVGMAIMTYEDCNYREPSKFDGANW